MAKGLECRAVTLLSVVVFVSTLIFVPGSASAAVYFTLGEEDFPGRVSGEIGGQKKPIRVPDQHAIVQIGIKEVADKPCLLVITAQHVGEEVTTKTPRYHETKYDLCSGKSAKSLRNASLWRTAFVNSVQVCLNKAGKRVKGLRVFGYPTDWADSAAKFIKPQTSDSFARPNCKHWKKQVSCGVDALATGLVAHFSDPTGSKLPHLMGLELICRPLNKTR